VLRLKVAGISSLTDARYCAGMGVEFLSLVFDSEGICSMSAETFAGIRPWIEGVKWIGEYSGSDAALLANLASAYELDTWISSYDWKEGEWPASLKLIRDQKFSEIKPGTSVSGIQIDFTGIPDEILLYELASLAEKEQEIMVGNLLPLETAVTVFRRFPNFIFSLRSSEEERPGWMDLGDLQDYLEALEEAIEI
jgi:phosphoribosylanthranilate isomerase